jgi:hypothetical protein
MLSVLFCLVLPIVTTLAFYVLRVMQRSTARVTRGSRVGLAFFGFTLIALIVLFCAGEGASRLLLAVMVLFCGFTGWLYGGRHPLAAGDDTDAARTTAFHRS